MTAAMHVRDLTPGATFDARGRLLGITAGRRRRRTSISVDFLGREGVHLNAHTPIQCIYRFACATPNPKSAGEHPMVRARRTKALRQGIKSWLHVYDRPDADESITVTLVRTTQRGTGLDLDNLQLALSPVRDAVADWLDRPGHDRARNVAWRYEQRRDTITGVHVVLSNGWR